MKNSSLETIHAALPHRPPMLLVDKILRQDDSTITAEKTFRADEYFFQGHYPDYPICPGVILCECGVQTGAILLSGLIDRDGSVPVLTKLENVRFKRMVRPGETIEMNVKLDDRLANAFYLSAQVRCKGQIAARFSFVCSTAKKPESP